mmetsp:Transcript_34668/g.79064  ORF Transcript_34668/g.79064 Transcript_34668/m.79064 type:complete len:313 (-) Transcript_34668:152-1090(-)
MGTGRKDEGVDCRVFSKTMAISPHFYKFLIGKKGSTKDRLQSDTGTNIVVPGPRSQSNQVEITGPSQDAVDSAATRIQMLVDSALESMPYTHFVSVPLVHAAFATELGKLISNVKENFASAQGFDESLFVSPKKLHLTLFMLKLPSPDAVRRASNILNGVCAAHCADLQKGTPGLSLGLHGLEYMNDDPSEVDVLFARVSPASENPLAKLCEALIKTFAASELLPESEVERQRLRRPDGSLGVKLHATVMSSKYRRNGGPQRQPFDASGILASYKDVPLGQADIPALHLSVLGPVDASTGYYTAASRAQLRK